MIPLWDMMHHSPEEQNPHECSSLFRTKTEAICVMLGSSDNEHSGNNFRRWCDIVGASILEEPTLFIFEVEE